MKRATGGIKRAALVLSVLGVMGALASCAHARPRSALGPPPVLPDPRRAPRAVVLPEWYWEPVDVAAPGEAKFVELPIAEPSLVRIEGATRVWNDLDADARARLLGDGLLILAPAPAPAAAGAVAAAGIGAFYTQTREQRIPYVVTLDALAYAVHVAFDRALAELDDTVLAPELDAFLTSLEKRLAAEQHGAGVEVGEALRLARSIVAVGKSLANDGAPAAPVAPVALDIAPAVAQEVVRIVAHEGPSPSPLLGVTIDYGHFSVPPGAARPGAFRALAWLANAPLVLVARTEVARAATSATAPGVGIARLHARTAMLLARFAEREVDPAVNAAWSKISRLCTFVWGPSDDLSPTELIEIASAIGVALEDPKNVANVRTVDRLRHRAAKGRAPLVFDGAGAGGGAGISMRLFGGHAPADSIVLASFVAPDGTRPLPSTLDLAVWMGAAEARSMSHEEGGDAWPGYDAALARAVTLRPAEDAPSRHASVHGSLLDVMMTWLRPPADASAPSRLMSATAQRAAVDSALAAWTYARHDGQPLTRRKPVHSARASSELAVTGAPLAAFVEPAPDVIARLSEATGQMRRGLSAIGGLATDSAGLTSLVEVDDLLHIALRIATREVYDEALSSEDAAAIASLPARLARLEGDTGEHPIVAQVFTDRGGGRILSSSAGPVETALMAVREPGTGRVVLAVGAHVPHRDIVETRQRPLH